MSTENDAKDQLIGALQEEVSDLRRMLTNLTEASTRSRDQELSWVYAMEGNRDGIWDWNIVTNEVFFSQRWKEMLGFDEDEVSNEVSEWESRIHADDRETVFGILKAHLEGETRYYKTEHRLRCKDGSYRWILARGKILSWTDEDKPLRMVGTHTDVTERKEEEAVRQRLLDELSEALSQVKQLSGLLPICSSCKKIRDDQGYWSQIETYIRTHSEASFSHGICPECAGKLYPELKSAKPGRRSPADEPADAPADESAKSHD